VEKERFNGHGSLVILVMAGYGWYQTHQWGGTGNKAVG
jgi:hypothetical protein